MKQIIKKKIESDEDIRLELIKENKLSENNSTHYVNNKQLLEEYVKYHNLKLEWEEKGLGIPPLTETIGKAILQIATRRCNSWYRVKNYSQSWKEEMIGTAVMYCALRGHNFDPTRFDNPFSYLTQICNNAIKEQLKKERKNLYIKYKSIEEANGFVGEFDGDDFDKDELAFDPTDNYAANERKEYISKFEEEMEHVRNTRVDKSEPTKVTLF